MLLFVAIAIGTAERDFRSCPTVLGKSINVGSGRDCENGRREGRKREGKRQMREPKSLRVPQLSYELILNPYGLPTLRPMGRSDALFEHIKPVTSCKWAITKSVKEAKVSVQKMEAHK